MITLINPGLFVLKKDPMTTGVVFMPFGLAYLASYLREQGFPVSVVDAFGQAPRQVRSQGKFMVFGLESGEILQRIPSGTSAIFIYAINLLNHDAAMAILQAVRKQLARVPIVIVENAQAVTAYSLEQTAGLFYENGADYIIVGDPEKRAVQLLENLDKPDRLRTLPGIGAADFFNPGTAVIEDLDALPFPAWDLFPLENYWALRFGHGPVSSARYLPLLTSRGCPYSCRFCVSPATNMKKWRARSAKNIVDEIEYYVNRFNVCEFHIEDLNPTVSEKRTREICEEILARNLDITWKIASGTKVETIKDEQTVELMAKAGCRYLSISPETGSERVLGLMNKPFDLDHAVRIVDKAKKEGIFCQGCFVLGFPGENDQDRQLTAKMVRNLTRKGIDEIAVFIVTPVPGAEIHGDLQKDISLSELNFTPTWRPDYTTLQKARKKLYRIFLLNKLLYHPLAIIRQVFNFFRRKFDTKMEMVPYRALMYRFYLILPPAARGAHFEKTAPLDPPQKLLTRQKFCGGPGGGSPRFSKEPPGFESILCSLCGSSEFVVVRPARYPDGWDKEKMIEVFCSSSDHKLLDQLVRCKDCGLVYINPRIVPGVIMQSYADAVDPRFVEQNSDRIRTFSARFKKLIEQMKITPDREKKVLDIGCAGGAFPKAAHDLGFSVTGIEPNKWMCEFARKEYGLDIRNGTVFHQDFPGSSFDIITLWDVLEHVPSPNDVLLECRKYLKDGGFLVLTYPDYGSWPARVLGKNWPFLLGVHLAYYTRKTIQKQLSQTGFVPLRLKPYRQTLRLGYLLERAANYFSIFKPLGRLSERCGLSKVSCTYYMGQTVVTARKQNG